MRSFINKYGFFINPEYSDIYLSANSVNPDESVTA